MARERGGVPGWVLALLGLGFVGAVAAGVLRSQQLADGPVPVVWDKTSCAHCRMAVSERGFAAQLQLKDGRVLDFDDPGCLFRLLAPVREDQLHALWFHHLREDRWLPGQEVGFVKVTPTPMGYGWGAVDPASDGAVTLQQARSSVTASQEAHR
ncbi:MAG: hypothetical protein M3Y59_23865 [Myxococcota bacterium]|nr:hypothetical protein [Myxococcota bacterium]